ncbi:hypothetical protein GH733_016761 [Mirounga leonina]|nr:hypothetical protein GH733_016761 [Mirounga leonina]
MFREPAVEIGRTQEARKSPSNLLCVAGVQIRDLEPVHRTYSGPWSIERSPKNRRHQGEPFPERGAVRLQPVAAAPASLAAPSPVQASVQALKPFLYGDVVHPPMKKSARLFFQIPGTDFQGGGRGVKNISKRNCAWQDQAAKTIRWAKNHVQTIKPEDKGRMLGYYHWKLKNSPKRRGDRALTRTKRKLPLTLTTGVAVLDDLCSSPAIKDPVLMRTKGSSMENTCCQTDFK